MYAKNCRSPDAGACGVLARRCCTSLEKEELPEEEIVRALYTAAGIGQVIAARAYIAGASGGCQAEIGTASAMAAGALVQLRGGDGVQITHAAAMALKNLLGLVCDPVAGLVEVPCVKRNVAGAVNALAAADMSLAGIVESDSAGSGGGRDERGGRRYGFQSERDWKGRVGCYAPWKICENIL